MRRMSAKWCLKQIVYLAEHSVVMISATLAFWYITKRGLTFSLSLFINDKEYCADFLRLEQGAHAEFSSGQNKQKRH